MFQILNKTSAGAISGTFAGLPQNAILTVANGARFRISYTGGNGNDLTLTALDPPTVDILNFSKVPGAGAEAGQDIMNVTASAGAGLSYLMEASPDLLAWSTFATVSADNAGALSFRVPQPGGILRRFYRIRLP